MKLLNILLLATLFPASARAAALETLWTEAQAQFRVLGLAKPGDFRRAETLPFVPAVGASSPVAQKLAEPSDPFRLEACAVVDALQLRQFRLKEAVSALEPCARAISARYGVAVSFGATGSGRGLDLRVLGGFPPGSPLLYHLRFGLARRGGSLLGYPAQLRLVGR